MTDYSNSVVYKLCCKDPEVKDIYIGYTAHKLNYKMTGIKQEIKKGKSKLAIFIKDHGGVQNWEISVIEKYPCKYREQIEVRKTYWFKVLKPTLNAQICSYNPKNLDVLITKRLQQEQDKREAFKRANQVIRRPEDAEYVRKSSK